MPIAVTIEFEGGTIEQYKQVMDLMGLTIGGEGPEGVLFHWAAVTDTGLRVTDVWETREQFDAFGEEQIGPHSATAGLGQPAMTFYDVAGYVTAPG